MTQRGWLSLAAGVVIAGLVGVLIVVVASAESPPSAREALARAQGFVDDADSVEYRGRIRDEFEGEVTVSRFEEEAQFPDRSRHLDLSEDYVFETLVIEDVLYTRDAEDPQALMDELWAEAELIEEEAGLAVPGAFARVIESGRRPQLLGHSGGRTTLRFAIADDALAAVPVYAEEPVFVLEVEDAGGRPIRLRFLGTGEIDTQTAVVEFESWNRDLEIEPPAPAAVDPTPFVDEEAVTAYDDAALAQPRVVPEGWELSFGGVLMAEDDVIPCDQVNLSYAPAGEDLGYLDLYELPGACAEDRPAGADDFVAGPYTGWVDEEEGYLYGQVVVGDTVIEFNSDLSVTDLAAILGDLVPLDLANPPAATFPLD